MVSSTSVVSRRGKSVIGVVLFLLFVKYDSSIVERELISAASVVTCSTEVVITVLIELLMVGLSVTTDVMLDPDFVAVY